MTTRPVVMAAGMQIVLGLAMVLSVGGCDDPVVCLAVPCPFELLVTLPTNVDQAFVVRVEGSDGSTFETSCPSPASCGGAVGVPIRADTVSIALTGDNLNVSRSFTPDYQSEDVGNCADCVVARVEFENV